MVTMMLPVIIVAIQRVGSGHQYPLMVAGGGDGDHGSGPLHDDAPQKILQRQIRASLHHRHGLRASLLPLLECMHAATA